ncbi:MAG: CTP synthase [archaeon]
MATKYIIISGGVLSGLGKGITASSIGRLLKARGIKVTMQKLDPYLNIDPGTMNPIEHGEVFVTDDGGETDLDLGHYERFIDEKLHSYNSISTGKIYKSVLDKERHGDYLGKTIQVIPHITDEIKEQIYRLNKNYEYEVCIIELGGTTGELESSPFLEAIRQVKQEQGEDNVAHIHVTYIPYLKTSKELKTKPTQQSVRTLMSVGLQPDILVCRSEKPLSDDIRKKMSKFCNVDQNCVIQNLDAKSLYAVPLMLEEEGLGRQICNKLKLYYKKPNLSEWENIVEKQLNSTEEINIALIGKYVELHDAYLSVSESLIHAGIANNVKINIEWINSEIINENNVMHKLNLNSKLNKIHGILVPGGFGSRGVEGKIIAAKYARENNIPYLGLCLGMQIAVIEFARNVVGLSKANSTEINPMTPDPVIHIMEDKKYLENMGGTLRLGAYPCKLKEGTKVNEFYNENLIYERHRHRYEFNNEYRNVMEENGLLISGISPDNMLVEIIEIKDHPFFIAVQFHPEFKSRPNKPHPLFKNFIKFSKENK